MDDLNAVDLFAGPGGWDEGLLELGIHPLGVEWDDAACQTRRAAGHATLQADVALLDPAELVPAGGHVDLLIGSPPCPTFSTAGGGSGHRVVDVILECLDALRDGRDERAQAREKAYEALLPDALAEGEAKAAKKGIPFVREKAEAKARRNANMSVLVVEPFRYALELRPRWIALEQVPPVLPIWERTADDLRALGWNVWTGLLSSERFGVPQTRERAILLADLERPVAEPRASHQRYVPPRKEADHERLFDPGRRERIVMRGEENLQPWVSMATALGWAVEEKPSRTLCGHHTPRWLYGDQQPKPVDDDGIVVRTRGERDRGDDYEADGQPARTVTGRARSWEIDDPSQVELRNSNQDHAAVRGLDEPAPTMYFGHRANEVVFVPRDGVALEERQEHGASRDADEPAPTLTASMDNGNFRWVQRERSGDRSEEGFDPDESPSQALTSKARSWRVRTSFGEPHRGEDAGSPTPEFDPADRPTRTIVGKTADWQVDAPVLHRVGEWEIEVEAGTEPPTEAEVELALGVGPWTIRTGHNSTVSRDPSVDPVPFERDVEAPAPTLDGHADRWTVDRPAPTIVGTRRSKDGMLAGRQLAPGEGENVGGWGYDRPSTTVAGDPRVPQPGHKMEAASPQAPRRMQDAVRLSVPEASVLQGFRPDYPWQGSRTKQFEQVGNAVPPPLARACVRAIVE